MKICCVINGIFSVDGCINIVYRKDYVVMLIKVIVNVNLVLNYFFIKLRLLFVIYIYE